MCDWEDESISGHITVDGLPIWYEKFGSGPKPLLLIPGAIGTGRTDFLPQLEDEDALDKTQFTIIVIELQGWGRSVPPERRYGSKIYAFDAKCCYQLMKQHFGYNRWLVFAWSDGCKSGLTLATTYPEAMESIVLMGVDITNANERLLWMKSIVNVDSWGQQKLDCYLRVYHTKDRVQDVWRKYIKSLEYMNTYYGDDMFKGKYHLIKCPVLIIVGDKDNVTTVEQCQYLCKVLPRGRLERFANGGHDIHMRYPKLFKEIVEKHFLKK